jgi:hypothetical protein
MFEIEGNYRAPRRGAQLQVPGLGNLFVAAISWEPRKGGARQIVTMDMAPGGTRIRLPDEETMQALGYELFTN